VYSVAVRGTVRNFTDVGGPHVSATLERYPSGLDGSVIVEEAEIDRLGARRVQRKLNPVS
jgi:hypothetical protein